MYNLICMVGLPRSGKTTYVEKNFKNYTIVCADDIRAAMGVGFNQSAEPFVWAIHDAYLKSAMIRGRDICIDNTSLSMKILYSYKRFAMSYKYKFRVLLKMTSLDICKKRNIGDGAVPDSVLSRMNSQLNVLQSNINFLTFGVENV